MITPVTVLDPTKRTWHTEWVETEPREREKMKFIAVIHQPNGCDYTIECGTKVLELEATTLDDAYEELRKVIVGVDEDDPDYDEIGSGYTGEISLSGATLYAINEGYTIDLPSLYQERQRVIQSQIETFESLQRRQEYERLKKEFE